MSHSEFKWYALQTFSRHEKKVKEFITETVKQEGLAGQVGEILIPTKTVYVMRGGKKRTHEKNDFPGYILVNAAMDKQLVHLFKEHIFKVKREAIKWVPSRDHPEPLMDDDIKRILGRIDETRESGDKPEIPFTAGDSIRVIDGPFNNFSGVVDDVYPDKMKVRVMVSIFGRKTPVELDYLQITPEE